LNLTVPHKLLALGVVDLLDESASTWGAVNTIRFEARTQGGEWLPLSAFDGPIPEETRSHGFNTDADAIVRAIREDLGVNVEGARVLLLGAGGAGRVAALKLASEKVSELYLVNRTQSKAEAVALEISRKFPGVKTIIGYPQITVDLLINATSLGLNSDDPIPLDSARFPLKSARAVYDMIYRPSETPLLNMARQSGCHISNGLGMLLHQGAGALEIWTGRAAPIEIMRQALLKHIYGA
jgi:shikimate dehydrogenase